MGRQVGDAAFEIVKPCIRVPCVGQFSAGALGLADAASRTAYTTFGCYPLRTCR